MIDPRQELLSLQSILRKDFFVVLDALKQGFDCARVLPMYKEEKITSAKRVDMLPKNLSGLTKHQVERILKVLEEWGVIHHFSSQLLENKDAWFEVLLLMDFIERYSECRFLDGNSNQEKATIYLNHLRKVWRRPEEEYHYVLSPEQYRIFRTICESAGWIKTKSISEKVEKDKRLIRNEIGRINRNLKKALGAKIIEGVKDSGYRIHPDCKIEIMS